MSNLKAIKNIYSGFAVCLIILGALILFWPGMAVNVLCKICGIVLVLFGVAKILGYFSKDLFQLAFQFDFAMGIISFVVGAVMIVWSERMMEMLTVAIGLFIIIDALLRIQTAIDAKRIGVSKWWIILAVSLATAVVGAILFFDPYHGARWMIRLLGANLVIDGILNLFVVQSTVSTIRRNKKWEA